MNSTNKSEPQNKSGASLAPARGSKSPDFDLWMREAKKRIQEAGVAVPTNQRFYEDMYIRTYGVAPVI